MFKSIVLVCFLLLVAAVVVFGGIKAYHFFQSETDLERRRSRDLRNEAEDHLVDLDRATKRFEKDKKKKGFFK